MRSRRSSKTQNATQSNSRKWEHQHKRLKKETVEKTKKSRYETLLGGSVTRLTENQNSVSASLKDVVSHHGLNGLTSRRWTARPSGKQVSKGSMLKIRKKGKTLMLVVEYTWLEQQQTKQMIKNGFFSGTLYVHAEKMKQRWSMLRQCFFSLKLGQI